MTSVLYSIPTLAESYDDPIDPPDFILMDLMIKNGSTILYGAPGAGKSTGLRYFVLCAVRGGVWAGRKFMKPCRVLWLALEDVRPFQLLRLRELGMTKEDASLIHLVCEDDKECEGFRRMEPFTWLHRKTEELRPDIIIIDTLIDFIPLSDSNDYSKMYAQVLGPMRHYGRILNTHIVATHHENRSGAFLGSVAFKAAPDNMICVEGSNAEFRIVAAMPPDGKVRYGEYLKPVKIYKDGRVDGEATPVPPEEAPHVPFEKKMDELVLAKPYEKQIDIVTEARAEIKIREQEAYRLVDNMVKAKPPRLMRYGAGGKADPYKLYHPTHPAPVNLKDLING